MNVEALRYFWNHYQLLDCVVALLFLVISTIVTATCSPYCRPFSWKDPSIDYPYVVSVTFPIWTLFLFLAMALVFYGLVVTSLGGPLWLWVKAQLLAAVSQQVIVNLLKIYAGRIRPDYLNRLRYLGFNEDSYAESGVKGITASEYYCRLGDKYAELREGRLSFPSGHSSTSFAVFTFMSLFLFAYIRPSSHGGSFVRLLLSLCPMIIAFLCAVSRTRDYWHHFDDVVAGALIGTVCSLLCFYNAFRITGGGLCVSRRSEAGENMVDVSGGESTQNTQVVTIQAN
ncbi:phosphatidic acid phosphatase protein [Trypanosoma theileri]|uniref:Phosphatidic acid phosphatase protein n=1 Tax=Trypanosoma theileri TaxID=67003 RepID=A0A1X0P677_9TRYP|nr:phosphatidic acid phosphatase protein [Trypanosoma theileri]ORC92375.1 phosphatidic acid phosphatase protein [Trypanosoma theileri]